MFILCVLASEPEIANLYTTKSGSKRIFQSAQVKIPFGEFDIYNKEQVYIIYVFKSDNFWFNIY